MKTDRELMQRMVEAWMNGSRVEELEAVKALRERLAQPVQEPVAWMWKDGTITSDPDRADGTWMPLYTTPPASKPWVGLTDEGVAKCWHDTPWNADLKTRVFAFARAIERAHGIGGEDN